MAAITNIEAAPRTGALNPVVTFNDGSQDQGGEIKASTAAANIGQGSVSGLTDGNVYRVSYDSAGNRYGPMKRRYTEVYGSDDAVFAIVDDGA